MTAKEYLSEVQRVKIIIEQKREKIKEYRNTVTSLQSVRFDVVKVQGGKNHIDRIGGTVSKIVDLETEVENDILNLVNFQDEITKQIQEMKNPNYIRLLYKRYIEGKKFLTIAEEMNYTDQYIREMHGKALKAFETANKEILQKEGNFI